MAQKYRYMYHGKRINFKGPLRNLGHLPDDPSDYDAYFIKETRRFYLWIEESDLWEDITPHDYDINGTYVASLIMNGGLPMVYAQELANTLILRGLLKKKHLRRQELYLLIKEIEKAYMQRHGDRDLIADEIKSIGHYPYLMIDSLDYYFKCFGEKKIKHFAQDAEGNVRFLKKQKNPEIFELIKIVWKRYFEM